MITTARLPVRFRKVADALLNDARQAHGEIVERAGRDDLGTALAAIAWTPPARTQFEAAMDDEWNSMADGKFVKSGYDEVVIGAGLHASIYSAVRRALGFKRPLVLEAKQRVGGEFAMSRLPAFYLNSRNRPGKLGQPGEGLGLNVLPGAPLQPCWLSDKEFQRNNDLAYIIRCTLAASGQVRTGCQVAEISEISEVTGARRYRLTLTDERKIYTDRVICATGFGEPVQPVTGNPNIITFRQFMARMDSPFPLAGADRVAVVGDGDSARCAIEALCGQGPGEHWSVPALDYPQKIDWYGENLDKTCANWLNSNRARYKQIGSLLQAKRVRVRLITGAISDGYEGGFVNARSYDLIIVCVGYQIDAPVIDVPETAVLVGGERLKIAAQRGQVYTVGAAAAPEFTTADADTGANKVAANKVALFRLAGRTAALAKSFS